MTHAQNHTAARTRASLLPGVARRAFAALSALGSLHCEDPLVASQQIERLRLLGAQAQVNEDPDVASTRAGDSVSVRWLLAAPSADPFYDGEALSYAFDVCTARYSNAGPALCTERAFATLEGEANAEAEPELEFVVPNDVDLEEVDTLLVSGTFCRSGGALVRDPLALASCNDPAETPLQARFEIEVGDGPTNHNPDLAAATFEFDGSSWAESGSEVPCDSLPTLAADGTTYDIALELPETAREARVTTTANQRPNETLQVSHLSTLGKLDRQFSTIEATDTNFRIVLPWTAPGELSAGDNVARFYFIVRDLRGGVSWTTRQLCLTGE